MARLLALCSLPRTNPKNRLQYVRRNGPYTLGMSAGINNKLPYGNIPRLLLAWVCSEAHPLPLDLHTLKALKRSPLGLDLYFWLTYRTFSLKTPLCLSWRQIFRQFGADPDKAGKKGSVSRFRGEVLRELEKINRAWPDLRYHTVRGALVIEPSPPRIPPAQLRLIE